MAVVATGKLASRQLAAGNVRGRNFDLSGRKSQAEHIRRSARCVEMGDDSRVSSANGAIHGVFINQRTECAAAMQPCRVSV